MNKVIFFILFLYSITCFASNPNGTIKGKVFNKETKEPLIGANVIILNTQRGTATNKNGQFLISNVPVGSYNLAFQYIGFKKFIKSDVLVRPGRITYLNIGLYESIIEGNQVTVTADYFQKDDSEPTSIISFNNEEIRRSPGSAGDVIRILMALPSTAQVHDMANDLMVRGGSPFENGFYIDNIQIPNLNHFAVHGTTGGGIGLINVDFIDDVSFYTGGFSAAFGDRLSSITDIKLREGNRDEYDAQIDMSLSGFGGGVEGPLPNQKGSWLFSARQGFLDLFVDAVGAGVAPRFGDIHAKLAYDINPQHKLTLLNIFGTSKIEYSHQQAIDQEFLYSGRIKTQQNTTGINWRYLWGKKGYSNTSLSHAVMKNDVLWNDVDTQQQNHGNESIESSIRVRNFNYYAFSKNHKLEFGMDVGYLMNDYNYFANSDTNRVGVLTSGVAIDKNIFALKAGIFLSYISHPLKNLTTTIGLRGDYFDFNQKSQLSPRFSLSYGMNERLTFNLAFGMFYQNLPLFLLSQYRENKKLDDPQAIHYVAGMDYMLTSDTKMTIEVYDKAYKDFPLTSDDPYSFVVDDFSSMKLNIAGNHLQSIGKAYSRGIELLIQKKLAQDFYGLVSATWFRSRYQDYLYEWRNRIFDNRYIFSIIGGYKPNQKWEFSARWVFAGGVPYTPFDIEKSKQAHTGIIDKNSINEQRYPDYHSLNIRVDRRFFFQQTNLILYLSIWNAYNRKNIDRYFWDPLNNRQNTFYQFRLVPILGMEFEF